MKDIMEIIALGLDEKGEIMSANILSILDSVKMSIGGIEPDCTDFDLQIILLINSTFDSLLQIGYGPSNGFEIMDNTTLWVDYIKSKRFNLVKNYIIAKVGMQFNPPASTYAMTELTSRISELEFRIKSEVECNGEEDV